MCLGFIRLRAGWVLLGVFWIIVVHYVSHGSNIIEVFSQDDSVFPLSVKCPAETFPINVFVGRLSSFILFAQVPPVFRLSASPFEFSLEFVGDGAML